MKRLTRKEEVIMVILWKLKTAFVKDIILEMPEPKPHYNTVSTTIRILQDKGCVGHESFGTSHRYYPILKKETYRRSSLHSLVKNYFNNSYKYMVAFFAKEEDLSVEELEEIINQLKK